MLPHLRPENVVEDQLATAWVISVHGQWGYTACLMQHAPLLSKIIPASVLAQWSGKEIADRGKKQGETDAMPITSTLIPNNNEKLPDTVDYVYCRTGQSKRVHCSNLPWRSMPLELTMT